MGYFLLSMLLLCSMFLMGVILIQRGRGGGLAGAFGGLGGQSAFGTKAGDVFTVITIVTAVLWVMLACVAAQVLRNEADPSSFYKGGGTSGVEVAPDPKKDDGKDDDLGDLFKSDERSDADAGKVPAGKAASKKDGEAPPVDSNVDGAKPGADQSKIEDSNPPADKAKDQ